MEKREKGRKSKGDVDRKRRGSIEGKFVFLRISLPPPSSHIN